MIAKAARALMLLLSSPDLFALKCRRKLRWKVERRRRSNSIRWAEKGVTFEFDLSLGEVLAEMYWGYYQPNLVAAVSRLLRPGDTFVDVGANVGYLSFIAAQCVGPKGSIHAFEPVRKYYLRLERLRELNPRFAITVNNCALGSV